MTKLARNALADMGSFVGEDASNVITWKHIEELQNIQEQTICKSHKILK